ncbi:hypothetical protein F4811DRAFT_419408 [Daldinia bambusicola]|nr:hypothetical protein F4811DRAFT_419408 [Daldinia bambusicola]
MTSQYGSLNPVQQYNQLSFAVIPETQQQQEQQLQQFQQQLQQLHQSQTQPHRNQPHQLHQPIPTSIPTSMQISTTTYQHQHPTTLPSTANAVAQQQQRQQHDGNFNSNTNASTNSNTNANSTTNANITPNTNSNPSSNSNSNSGSGSSSSPSVTPSTTPATSASASFAPPQRKRRRVGRPPKSQLERDYLEQRASNALQPPSQQPPPPPQAHTPHPLNKGPYATSEDAVFSLQQHVFSSGYGVSQKRTVKEKLPSGRYDPDGDVIRKDFACDRGGGGAGFVSQSTGERRRESRKCGCAWRAVVRRLKRENDLWFVEVVDPAHNHPVTPPELMHTIASYRRWQRENGAGIRTAIARLARAAAMPARQIGDYLKGQFEDPDLAGIDRHILRALSMGDVDAPGGEAQQAQTVFEVVARRPTIILQETPGEGGGGGGGSSGSNTIGGATTGVSVGVNPTGPNRYQ